MRGEKIRIGMPIRKKWGVNLVKNRSQTKQPSKKTQRREPFFNLYSFTPAGSR
jgi:hypothetical protein